MTDNNKIFHKLSVIEGQLGGVLAALGALTDCGTDP